MARYWLRTVRGLEWLVAAEVARAVCPDEIRLGHRDVFVDSKVSLIPTTLRCPDDVFQFWTCIPRIGRTRDALSRLTSLASCLPPPPYIASEMDAIHLTASFLGQRNYSRGEVERSFGHALATRLGLRWCEQAPENTKTLRVRLHIVGGDAVLGVALTPKPTHRRAWRNGTQPGMLHPPVAACMVLIAQLRDGLAVQDPFAGSGTILIEAGLCCPNLTLLGWDISEEAVAMARDHAARAGVQAVFQVKDAMRATGGAQKVDRVISNPPWERSVTTVGPLRSNPLSALTNLLGSNTGLVSVADQEMKMPAFLEGRKFTPEIVFPIRVSGRLADVAVVNCAAEALRNDIGQYWDDMNKIPWEGEQSKATLEVPSGWDRLTCA